MSRTTCLYHSTRVDLYSYQILFSTSPSDKARDLRTVKHKFQKLQAGYWLAWFPPCFEKVICTLRWRHNERDGVSNHRRLDGSLKSFFRQRSKQISKLRVTGLCVGNSPVTCGSPHKRPVTRKMFPFNDVIMHTVTAHTAFRAIREISTPGKRLTGTGQNGRP